MKKIVVIILFAVTLFVQAHDVDESAKVTGTSGTVTISITPSGETHTLTKTGDGVTWNYSKGEKQTDLSEKAAHIWYGMIALGVVTAPDQKDLPGHEAKEVADSVTYNFQVAVDNVNRSYSYSNPTSYSDAENAKIASIISLLGGIASLETITDEPWQHRKIRERDEREDKLNSYVGKTIKKMESSTRGTLHNVEVIRRKGDHYIIKHTKGTVRIESGELIEAIDGK